MDTVPGPIAAANLADVQEESSIIRETSILQLKPWIIVEAEDNYEEAKEELDKVRLHEFLVSLAVPRCTCPLGPHGLPPECGIWLCPGCLTFRPWCFGGADDLPDLCDDCWAEAHKDDK